ncbi:thiaminase/transcriptional activator TenA [Paenarthrobacter nicotinovorans]|uniref:TenA family protein n=1 Tax=Micrococcaceae TaxID=1268 RepID=UPI0008767C84|nr:MULTISPECIES: TenA family protein [Micrococcaceae]MDR6437808.1 thiaminase/transcriptional activator TenA [Paenarthrobacter nicotinovorans]BCW57199.1 aminopyrimidine aminohydrolase [Arthrobacter sp. StoSoilB20]SCZ64813.1 thiaminase (transcriptional activator TenA) [Arthrobacter sp. UNCCL28]
MGFAEELRNQSAIDWDAAVNHPFVDQLLDGSLPDERLRQYLVQDYQFCDAFTALLGQAVASAPSLPSRLVFARVLGAFASDENTYFQDCFDELDVPETERTSPALGSATQAFDALMREALASRSYPEVLAVLLVAEWLYGEWAGRAGGPAQWPSEPKHSEWIRLHNNPEYNAWVTWLRDEFDAVEPSRPQERQRVAVVFAEAVRLERAFFDAALVPDEAYAAK